MGHFTVSCANGWTDRDIFWTKTRVGPRNHVLDGSADSPRGRGTFLGCPGHSKALATFPTAVVAAFAAKGNIRYPITSCNRKDHSGCQASTNSILKISEHRRCGLSAVKGEGVRLHSAGEVWYLRLPCCCCQAVHAKSKFSFRRFADDEDECSTYDVRFSAVETSVADNDLPEDNSSDLQPFVL